jgi:CRP/FNR family transcriptional regulator, cyclic AMP receptor protein
MSTPTTPLAGELRVPKGTIIFRQGDPGHEMFVVAEGRVRLTLGTAGNEKEISVCTKGDFFGELSLLSGAVRTATAEAAEDSTLLVIGRDVFGMMVQDDIDIVFRMMNIQGERLGRTNRPIEELIRQIARIRVLAEGLRQFLAAGQSTISLDIEALVRQLNLSSRDVLETIEDAARRGGGTLNNGRWQIAAPSHANVLIEILCDYATRRGEPGAT